ncbi:MAG: Rieske 2Fe-2S domain-containing protein [Aliidongia sp.]
MSAGFRAVQWNRHKLVYDAVLITGIVLYLAAFLIVAFRIFPADPPVTWEIQRLRAFGSCAFIMVTLILCIGPLARLDRRFLPVLYNRRHFGVLTFCVALIHAYLSISWYHGVGKIDPLLSVLVSNPNYLSFIDFPFEIPGLMALLVLFLMAATSHDFWLAFLTPPVWKAIHMSVYAAYALLVFHVALGVMQTDRSVYVPILLDTALLTVAGLQWTGARRERPGDDGGLLQDGWLPVGAPQEIVDGRARIVTPPGGERIAVYRHGGVKLSAVANVCAHQNGPLGEGRIIDGLITCPWHGFQFRPEDGCAPPPFTDKIPTYRLRLDDGTVFVDPRPLPPGTAVPPLLVEV